MHTFSLKENSDVNTKLYKIFQQDLVKTYMRGHLLPASCVVIQSYLYNKKKTTDCWQPLKFNGFLKNGI